MFLISAQDIIVPQNSYSVPLNIRLLLIFGLLAV